MQSEPHKSRDENSVPDPLESWALEDREVAIPAAFRWLPIGFAFAFCFLAIYSMVSFKNHHFTSSGPQGLSNNAPAELNLRTGENSSNRAIKLSGIFTHEVQSWQEDILRWSKSYDLDPNMIALVMQIESCGHPDVESFAGAKGLFQVMPFHFGEGEDPLDPETNARRGLSYLSRSLEIAKGDPTLAFAGYNGGHGVINWQRSSWPDETKRYVYWASGILEDIRDGDSHSQRLEEWLSSGGASLCQRAAASLGLHN
ncbi:MAG: transglycosylase SLT domain-containing protein [Anaerolineales bacterium]|nr:transglycosylase SLT domain-containing protein [Anaerolineales bacterium]